MDEFARTRQGQTFFQSTLPNLVDALNRLASAVEENNRLMTAETEAEKPVSSPNAFPLKKDHYRWLKEVVKNPKSSKIEIIKTLRNVTGWNLKISKGLTDRYFTFHGSPGDPKGFMMNFTEEE